MIAIGARSSLDAVEQEVRQAAQKAGRQEPKIFSIALDVSDSFSVTDAARKVESEFGRLDILVNNAGILETFKPIADSDIDAWWTTYEVNVKGVYLCSRTLLPLLLKGGLKTIVNVSSIGANVVMPGASG
jgi:NAD(P)-dependent dehydrogenase (short-subunit alcohol dehydrogenase family)